MTKFRDIVANIIVYIVLFFSALVAVPAIALIMVAEAIRGTKQPSVSKEEMTRRMEELTNKIEKLFK
ncbi:hypothetical protein [Klebsiella phage PhiKpNIH-6]|jgi:hypothetical protein|uniref:Uncharacterized protein n=5 Tax=Marfavirus F48 TaxID=2845079 RepID=A0A5P8PJU9_9CAUD|nr:hypothetical protein HWB49_gp068 [Klebsiella phage vB_Kpn_F48]QEG12679.1 hypothetical protein POTTS_69 [Klebsiella phage vB_KpnM_Potts1]QEM42274.1 hypothetical protein CPTPhageEI1_069 [Klebsiella phage EI]QFR57007.1 hypothetical protein AmPhEK29_0070 [Klebsiella phage AmPh_EK29]QGZ15079.1 hypothetical protein [Klebsiella phage vB_Kpn_P545]QHB49415.1 hypothetical protein [Klebsiella phage PhiKpNIH-6]UJD05591.1 hypothetical protein PWKp16_00244 [Klebsiella phage PWKp16]